MTWRTAHMQTITAH